MKESQCLETSWQWKRVLMGSLERISRMIWDGSSFGMEFFIFLLGMLCFTMVPSLVDIVVSQ
ncbi:unnamed protein product [Camellia sinensis]